MKPKLSIIIPVYNVEKYLEQCMKSVIAQIKTGQAEVLVIDDGSLDSSGEIVDFYAEKYPFIRVTHQENLGVAAARNTGMDLAEGEWLYFMDSDDWLAEGAINHLLKRCEQCPDSDVILFDAWKDTGSQKTRRKQRNIKSEMFQGSAPGEHPKERPEGGDLALAAVTKCLQAATWIVARRNKEWGWEHFSHETVWRNKSEIRDLQSGTLYFPSTKMVTKIPLAAPWDKVYRRKFLTENGICFLPELKVLDDMTFNMEVFGAAGKVSYFKDKIYHYRLVADSITNQYKADRIDQDQKVWKYLNDYMKETFEKDEWTQAEKDQFIQAYYCRIIKSFSICCRLCFFHEKNTSSFGNKIRYIKEALGTEPYRMAFRDVRLRNAEWKLKVMICMGRCRLWIGIYLLYIAQKFLRWL